LFEEMIFVLGNGEERELWKEGGKFWGWDVGVRNVRGWVR
jgi:hypothetical protein